jgi:ferredoxin-NADP reductase/Na+-translocating ferredoxin:NAD+ oxidoreductase RnfD subunit
MYRLVIYCLIFLIVAAAVLGYFNILPYAPIYLLFSAFFIVAVSWLVNSIFSSIFEAPSNFESTIITALILAIIITPPRSLYDSQYFTLAVWATILAIASKYILAIKKKHIFNPAAIAVVLTSFGLNLSASWWIGTAAMMPFVLISGALLMRKIKRWDLVLSFFITAFATILLPRLAGGENPIISAEKILVLSPILFFAFIMLTEPLTTPPKRNLRIIYGMLVGFLFAPFIHIGGIYSTPELTLVAGNVFSYLISPKKKLILKLKEKIKIADSQYDFIFESDKKFNFKPGQYMEWTLKHPRPDSRGIRRYFTIASSPTENEIRVGIKFYPHAFARSRNYEVLDENERSNLKTENRQSHAGKGEGVYEKSSSFKKALIGMKKGDIVVASQLSGDFVLPKDPAKKLVFMAGGIGITPFRSMIKYLIDKNEKRQIIIFYSNKNFDDIAYKEILEEAEEKLGIKTIYAITDMENIPGSWAGYKGRLTPRIIAGEAPDYGKRDFYISGPPSMVANLSVILKDMGVRKKHIKTDYFPGFA